MGLHCVICFNSHIMMTLDRPAWLVLTYTVHHIIDNFVEILCEEQGRLENRG